MSTNIARESKSLVREAAFKAACHRLPRTEEERSESRTDRIAHTTTVSKGNWTAVQVSAFRATTTTHEIGASLGSPVRCRHHNLITDGKRHTMKTIIELRPVRLD